MPVLNYAATLVAGVNENINDVQARLDEIRAVVNALDDDNFDIGGTPLVYEKLNLAGKLVNADVKSDAALAYSKLAALAAGNILVGSAGNVATSVNPTGMIDVSSAGVVTFTAEGETEIESLMAGGIPASQRDSDATIAEALGTNSTTDVLECTLTVPTGGALVEVMMVGFLQRQTAGIDAPDMSLEVGDTPVRGPQNDEVNTSTLTTDTQPTMVFTTSRLGLGSAEAGGGAASLAQPRALIGNGEDEIVLGSSINIPAVPTPVILNLAAGSNRIEYEIHCVAAHYFTGQMYARVVQSLA